MSTSVSSHITSIHVQPCVIASTTCRVMITSSSSWVVSRSLLSMATPLKISTGIEAGPVTSRLCFIVASWVFPFSHSCSQIVSMVCCWFSFTVRTTSWAERHPLLHLFLSHSYRIINITSIGRNSSVTMLTMPSGWLSLFKGSMQISSFCCIFPLSFAFDAILPGISSLWVVASLVPYSCLISSMSLSTRLVV